MKKLILAAALLALLAPGAAFAQAGPGPGPGPGPGAGRGPGMGRGPGPGWSDDGPGPGFAERGKRAKLALTLGLAEALDLDDAQALKLRDAVEKFHQKREPLHQQMRDAMQVLRKAADGEKVEAAAVDQALAKVLEVRAQAQAADRELVQAVTKDQPPQKKARAALFLARFGHRMEERMGPMGRHHGPRHQGPRGAPGMRRGQGPGPTGMLEQDGEPVGEAMAAFDAPPPPFEDDEP